MVGRVEGLGPGLSSAGPILGRGEVAGGLLEETPGDAFVPSLAAGRSVGVPPSTGLTGSQPAPPPPQAGDAGKVRHPVAQYFIDKGKDLATLVALTAVNPLSVVQNVVSFVISVGSTGKRIPGKFGFAMYEDSKGLSKKLAKALGGPPAYAPGYLAFSFVPYRERLFIHEHQHALQSLVAGPLYYPGLLLEAARAARECGANSECIHRVSRFELDAARAEKVGLHFPFIEPGTSPGPPAGA